jgi:hypothetical protein
MSNETQTAEAKQPAQPPVAKVRIGLITGSIWERKTENGTFYSVTFERRYRDGETFRSSHSYNADDLLVLGKVADLAHSRILELRAGGAA